jgi:septal ring factor EnvC (AmiA/AmiB activator)
MWRAVGELEHIAELEKEIAKLKAKLEKESAQRIYNLNKSIEWKEKHRGLKKQLTKAKDLIKNIIRVTWGEGWNYSLGWKVKAEQFIKDSEVEK